MMAFHWLNRTEYPFRSNFLGPDGQRVHYLDEGTGPVLLFVHGTPSWSFDFRHCIRALSGQFRCVAMDHLGFGLSDKPQGGDYSLEAHGKRLDALTDHLGLQDITLVVHDFGGPIGLGAAIRRPGLFSRLVVLNSWLWSAKGDPDYERLAKVLRSPLLPFLYRWLNFSPRFILPSSFGKERLPKALLSQYTLPFADRTQREGALAFARSLLHDQSHFQSLWEQRQAISAKPALFVWGMADPVIKPHLLEGFLGGFPHSTAVRLEGCGHFPQEERPQEVIAAMRAFLGAA